MKIRPVGAELFHAYRRTDMTKLTVAFRNFENAPKNAFAFEDRSDFCAECLSDFTGTLTDYDKSKNIGRPPAFLWIANFLIAGVHLFVPEHDSFIA
jgi:hypothetical protein